MRARFETYLGKQKKRFGYQTKMMKKMNVKTTHRGTKYQIMMLYKEEKQHKLKRNKKKFIPSKSQIKQIKKIRYQR